MVSVERRSRKWETRRGGWRKGHYCVHCWLQNFHFMYSSLLQPISSCSVWNMLKATFPFGQPLSKQKSKRIGLLFWKPDLCAWNGHFQDVNNITEHQRVERKIKPVMCPKPELQLTEVTYTYANHIIFTTAVSKIKKKHKCCMQFSLHKEASSPLSFAHISVHPALSILIIFSKQLNPERGGCCNN